MEQENLHKLERDNFSFYRSFMEQLDMIDDEVAKKDLLWCIARYGLYKEETEIHGILSEIVWKGIKAILDSSWNKTLAGRQGGGQLGNNNASKNKTTRFKDKRSPAPVGFQTTNTDDAAF